LDRRILKAAQQLIREQFDPDNDPALVLAQPDWHLGVIGIVAGRVAQQYHRPTVMISLDSFGRRHGVGSCRTACGVNLYQALEGSRQFLVGFGGHEAAAGLTIASDQVDSFRECFCEQVVQQVCVDELIPDLEIDAEALLGNLTLSVMQELERLAPFGQDNPRPVLCVSGVRLAEPVKTMGADGRHLSMTLKQHDATIRAVAFGKAEWASGLADLDSTYDFAFRPVINQFRGYRSVELQLIDFRPSSSPVVA
jgi:single-stranded-DNA-specific exonuclease